MLFWFAAFWVAAFSYLAWERWCDLKEVEIRQNAIKDIGKKIKK